MELVQESLSFGEWNQQIVFIVYIARSSIEKQRYNSGYQSEK